MRTETEKEYNARAVATRDIVWRQICQHLIETGRRPAAILAAGETFSMLIENKKGVQHGKGGLVYYKGVPVLLAGRGVGCFLVSDMRAIEIPCGAVVE